MGVCKRVAQNYCKNCPYLIDKTSAWNSWIMNMNYSYFLNMVKAAQIKPRSILVLDESHCIENELIKAGNIKLTKNVLKMFSLHSLDLPDEKATYYDKHTWLFGTVLPKLKEQYLYYKNQIAQFDKWKFSKEAKKLIAKYMVIDRMITIISEIQKEIKVGQKVIITSNADEIEYKVLYGYNLFDRYFNGMADRFLHMSATILNKEQYCKKLNLDYDEVAYFEYESEFPIENRLIHFLPVGSLSWKQKSKTIPKLVKKVQELLDKHKDEKGIIHTVNYELAEIICDQLYGTDAGRRLLIPRGKTRQTVLNTFYKSENPYVLISPSLAEGLDLKDDLSRFCIICKMPYANISDKWIKTRMSLDQTWYNNYTAENLIQMTGRSIRSKTDFATTYILDEDFLRFAETNYYILPQWWKDAVLTE
jgi:Rad3-related DNA helicase